MIMRSGLYDYNFKILGGVICDTLFKKYLLRVGYSRIAVYNDIEITPTLQWLTQCS
jgi:hypothetical protein